MKRSAPLKRSAFKRKAPPITERGREILAGTAPKIRLAFDLYPMPDPKRATMAANLGAEPPRPAEKDGTFRSRSWREAVASLACACCGKPGPSQCAHVNHRGKGAALKAPDCWTFPLCPDCHREFDQGKTYTKDQRRETADGWVIETIKELAQRGLIRA